MDLTGRLTEVSRDWNGHPMIKFRVNENLDGIEALNDTDLKIKVSKVTRPRSLDANAYFHVLCDKLRQKLGISMAHMKNILITSYGQIEYIEDGKALIYKTNAPTEYIQELEEAHMKFMKVGEDGAYWYKVYRGSHTYDTREMHILLEGTIADAKEQGIETKTPNEIRRMEELWKEHSKHHSREGL